MTSFYHQNYIKRIIEKTKKTGNFSGYFFETSKSHQNYINRIINYRIKITSNDINLTSIIKSNKYSVYFEPVFLE